MPSVSKLTAETTGSGKLIAAQQRLHAPADRIDELKVSLTNSLCEMIKQLAEPLDSESATALFERVSETHFDTTLQLKISEAIEEALLCSRTAPKLAPTEKQMWKKKSHAVLKYFTKSDWEVFCWPDTPFNAVEKVSRAVHRLSRGGLCIPSPPLCADIVAMLAAAVCEQPVDEVLLYREVHKLMQSFDGVELDPGIAELPVIKQWPGSPNDLPAVVKSAMYPDPADQAVDINLPAFASVREVTSCRDANKSIREKIKTTPTPSQALASITSPTQHVGGLASSSFAANMGAFLQSAQALGLSPAQIAMMGAHLCSAGDAPPMSSSNVGLKFFTPAGPSGPTGGAGAADGTADGGVSVGLAPTKRDAPVLTLSLPTDDFPAAADGQNKSPPHATPLPSAAASVDAALDPLDAMGALGRRPPKNADSDAKTQVLQMEQEHKALLENAKAKATAAKELAAGTATAPEDNGKKRKLQQPGKVPLKRPAACTPPTRWSASVPKMPEAGEGIVIYKGGKISCAPSRKGWRVWPNSVSVTIEKGMPFGGDKRVSFNAALSLIDVHWRSTAAWPPTLRLQAVFCTHSAHLQFDVGLCRGVHVCACGVRPRMRIMLCIVLGV
ncbi:unnamed protein product [Prorocentrum cordatum]|uniref:Uncharacterized protein n=1 Tax=Prorocentrum cordatum TaxID=2364126 RepID=A0ABN9VR30_9DINO|nr:unnamed protein product [Polarella glacialis]